MDSQRVKTICASDQCGIDGGKKVKGRKRHIVVDTLGNLIHVIVNAANTHDSKTDYDVLKATTLKYETIEAFSGDAGYQGTSVDFVEQALGLKLLISDNIPDIFGTADACVVNHTFAWLVNYRRLSKDYETMAMTAEDMVRIAMLRITIANSEVSMSFNQTAAETKHLFCSVYFGI